MAAVVLLTAGGLAAAPPARAAERSFTYTVTTQGTVYGDVNHVRAVAAATLNDVRGWSLGGSLAYREVATGGHFRIVLASPAAVAAADPACSSLYSCRVGNSVYINDNNWRHATPSWTHGVAEYRPYVLMHEVGHWLGLGHTNCPAGGQAAAVMQQQSKSLQGCLANVWPLAAEREAVARIHGVSLHRTPIEAKHRALGRSASVVGPPTVWERPLPGGSFQHFQRGSIYHSGATGAREVHGAIRERWSVLGWERGPLGYPTTDELATPDRVGRFNHFNGTGGGSVYWTPGTGAHAVYGDIRDTWERLGWERGPLGYPVTSETATVDGVGRYNNFTGTGGGSIVWTPRTGAHAVYGDIRDTWERLGWERGPLGYPVTSETGAPDGVGRYNHFNGSGGASIYWTPRTGAQAVHGAIRARWAALGWEQGRLGYPVRGQHEVSGGQAAHFQGGSITWSRATGQTTVVYSG